MTAKEYLKQAYLLDKQIQVEVKELEQLRDMRGTIQGCSYGERIGSNPNRNLEAPFITVSPVALIARTAIAAVARDVRGSVLRPKNTPIFTENAISMLRNTGSPNPVNAAYANMKVIITAQRISLGVLIFIST